VWAGGSPGFRFTLERDEASVSTGAEAREAADAQADDVAKERE
jgi:hypothetical protein